MQKKLRVRMQRLNATAGDTSSRYNVPVILILYPHKIALFFATFREGILHVDFLQKFNCGLVIRHAATCFIFMTAECSVYDYEQAITVRMFIFLHRVSAAATEMSNVSIICFARAHTREGRLGPHTLGGQTASLNALCRPYNGSASRDYRRNKWRPIYYRKRFVLDLSCPICSALFDASINTPSGCGRESGAIVAGIVCACRAI